MRILYFTRDYSPHDHRFLNALASSGNDIFFMNLEHVRNQAAGRQVPAGVEHVSWPYGKEPARWQRGFGYIRSFKEVVNHIQPDLVHAGPLQKPALITALSGYHPLVSMSWGSDILVDTHRNCFWRWATRYTLNHTDILLGDCQAVANKAVSMGFPAERIVLFPWGVDLKHFQPGSEKKFRERLEWEDAFILLSLRSWEPLYGVEHLLRGFVKAAREIPALRLLLLGKGSQESALRNILIQADMLDRVHFGGQVSLRDLPRFYRAADLYMSASHSDGSSVSLMEALASGLPVLVSDIPGNLEWIEEDRQGWFFPDGDEAAIYRGIIQAYRRRDELKSIRECSRRTAEERADWSRNFQKLIEAYKSALKIGEKNVG